MLEDPSGKTLFFILRDATSKTTTYNAARFLHTGLPDHGLDQPGTLMLDFNRLENPACAYTPYATCPLPPEDNRLPVAIEAGEKRYARVRVAASHSRHGNADSFEEGCIHLICRGFLGSR